MATKNTKKKNKQDTCEHPNLEITLKGHSFWTYCPDCKHVQA